MTPEQRKQQLAWAKALENNPAAIGHEKDLSRALIDAESELADLKSNCTEDCRKCVTGEGEHNYRAGYLTTLRTELSTCRAIYLQVSQNAGRSVDLLESAGMGGPGKANCLVDMAEEAATTITSCRDEVNGLREALREARCWMIGWGSGTPSTRGARCESAYEAHQLIQSALTEALAASNNPVCGTCSGTGEVCDQCTETVNCGRTLGDATTKPCPACQPAKELERVVLQTITDAHGTSGKHEGCTVFSWAGAIPKFCPQCGVPINWGVETGS